MASASDRAMSPISGTRTTLDLAVDVRLLAILAVAGALASCSSVGAGTVVRYGGDVSSHDTERGRGRYDVVCAPCHEDHNDRRAPLFANIRLNAQAIRHQVREGDALMPAIPMRRLSAPDLEALLAFLQSTGTCVPDDPDPAVKTATP